MADGQQRRWDVGMFARIKPMIYHSTDGEIIVEDELLNFLLIKSRTLSGWRQGESPGLSPARWSGGALEKTEHPSWSTMVRDSRKRKAEPENSAHRFTAKSRAEELSTVKTKMVSVFATKFKMNLDADILHLFLQGKRNREVKCRKI
ncbi:unnamed protein product [Pleuronectes platessa]|uniref:Uncharacterized protein n=1 Tax=Pleuronectes platessa TaxID=8262 RepID=A0A9N7TY48_PLEPL|nr:unnamed protein product [Pleuronectes platessa]